MTDFDILGIEQRLASHRQALLTHSLYRHLGKASDLRVFMEFHVFAVWDFMVLLKALQRRLTSVEEAWQPSESRTARRLINDIVLAEESDLDMNGAPASHYEMYLAAMKQAGARTQQIHYFMQQLRKGHSYKSIIRHNLGELDEARLAFLKATQQIVASNQSHAIAAAFTFGREDLIPELFAEVVQELNRRENGQFSAFVFYLKRHIEIDGDEHGPMARQMLRDLCGNDEQKWEEAAQAAEKALVARCDFWDAIKRALPSAASAAA